MSINICINKGTMLQLKNMFKGVKTLLTKYNSSKKKETKEKYYNEIKDKLDTQHVDKVFREDIQRPRQGEKQRKQIENRLKAAQKRQRKLENERVRQDKKLTKLEEQRRLSNRLLSDEERNLLMRRKNTQALGQDELNKINKRLRDDKLEQRRRRKNFNTHGRDVRGRRGKLDRKFEYLKDILKKVRRLKDHFVELVVVGLWSLTLL